MEEVEREVERRRRQGETVREERGRVRKIGERGMKSEEGRERRREGETVREERGRVREMERGSERGMERGRGMERE